MLELYDKVRKEIVGRDRELLRILSALEAKKHLLLEGPPGTSKSTILRTITRLSNIPFYLLEGNIDLTPAKLVGHFNPAEVISDNYKPEYFNKGPLTKAMEEGGFLYIEEFNRMPADATNVLLVAMEEGEINIPRYGKVVAKPGFTVICAQNPLDDVGTLRVSRAFLDRVCRIKLDYQSEEEEIKIVEERTGTKNKDLIKLAVKLARETRDHPDLKLGVSIRGPIDMVQIAEKMLRLDLDEREALLDSMMLAFSGKVWLDELSEKSQEEVLEEIFNQIYTPTGATKKKVSLELIRKEKN
jgi:MoxR-like ATPase